MGVRSVIIIIGKRDNLLHLYASNHRLFPPAFIPQSSRFTKYYTKNSHFLSLFPTLLSLREWIGKKADREREKEEKRQARLERQRAEPRHQFDDRAYMAQKAKVADNLQDALQAGSHTKRIYI